ncbi:MAG: carbohydrate ABC transporter permease [Spirochaetaceae bacterium]
MVYIALGTPIAIFLYQGYVKTIPYTLEESAIIDGAGPITIFFRIIFPLLKPMTSTIVILQSLYIWNDFLLPLISLSSESVKTIPLGIAGKFFGQYAFKWNLGITAMLLASLPMLVLYILLQRHIIGGVMRGSVKF